MPKIRLLHDVYKDTKKKQPKEIKIPDSSTEERSKYYNSKHWKTVRNTYITQHPLCELSLLRGLIVPATCVHHCIKFYDQYNDSMRYKLLCDQDNLLALSNDMHNYIHNNQEMLDDNQKAFIRQKKDYVSWKYLQEGTIINYTNDINTKSYHK